MRFVLAAVAFVASVVALIIGGVAFAGASQATTVTATGTSENGAPVMVVGSDVLASRAGLQDIRISGEGSINVVIGRSSDVAAWVGHALHDTVEMNDDAQTSREQLTLRFTESGSETKVPSPIGNDLWFEEHEGEGEVQLSTIVAPGYAMLITSDGEQAAPAKLSITWPLGGYAPTAGPLLVAGSVLMVLALGLLWWAVVHRRKQHGFGAVRGEGGAAQPVVAVVDTAPWSAVRWDDEAQQTAEERAAKLTEGEPVVPEVVDADAPIEFPVDELPELPELPALPEPEPELESEPMPEPEPESPFAAQSARVPTLAPTPEPEPVSEPEAAPELAPPPTPEPVPEPGASSDDESKWKRPRGKNRSKAPKRAFLVAPVALVVGVSMSGCAPQYWPAEWTDTELQPTGTATSTVDAALIDEGAHPPALNSEQLAAVLAETGEIATDADAKHDAKALAARFTGAALAERSALYTAQQKDAELPSPVPFPTGDVVYAVPEATDEFPRVIFAVVNSDAEAGSAPSAVMLVQQTARDNFKVALVMQLAPNVTLPDAAPASVGAPGLRELPDELVIAPDQLASAYADVIAKGDASEHAGQFSVENDSLRSSVNDAYRKEQTDALDAEVTKIEFGYAASEEAPMGITSLDGGAIVAVSITETERVTAVNDRARITLSGSTAALSGITTTSKGFERVYTDQVLFYVPSAEEGGQVQFLGVSQAMTSASEVQ